MKFSYFSKPINQQEPADKAITLSALYNFMKGTSSKLGRLKVEDLTDLSSRALSDPEAKRMLPYVTFSSEFEKGELRRLSSAFKHTGLFVMDIDKISNAEQVYYMSTRWEHCVFSFLSPSGNGVKVVVRADLTESQILEFGHSVVCAQLIDVVEAALNVKVDPLKDSTRACFIRRTDDVFMNSSAKPITVKEEDLRSSVHEVQADQRNTEAPENPITSRTMIFRLWKGTERRLGRFPIQSRYAWLVSFVTECHKKGIDRTALLRFMNSHVKKLPQMEGLSDFDLRDYTESLTKKVYSKYSDEFGVHYDWYMNNSTRYQYPIDGLDLGGTRVADVASFAAENFPEFMFNSGKFWKFDGRVFKPIDEDLDTDFRDMVTAITPADRPSTIKMLISDLKARMGKPIASLKGMPKMLFTNGVLNTKTWEFREYSEQELLEERFVCEFNYPYNEHTSDAIWNDMVKRVLLPNEKLEKEDDSEAKENLMYEFIGYALFGNGQAEQVLLFTGKGANGKSSLINTIIDAMPANIVESISPSQFGERFTGANLVGKVLNIVPDIDYSDLGNEAKFKKIVSNESILVEEKFKKPWTAPLHCSHIFAANGDLQFKNNDNALDRRFLTILLEQVFYSEDRDYTLKDRLKNDSVKQTIINKAVEGWKRYQSNGLKFTLPESSIEAQKERVKELDHTRSFFETALVYEDGEKCSLQDVVNAYEDWCMSNSVMRSERVPHHKMGGKLREYIQYEAPKDVKIVRPKGKVHVKNARVEFNPDMSAATEMVDEGLSFVKGVTR